MALTPKEKDLQLFVRIHRNTGVMLTMLDIRTLRRAAHTLYIWRDLEHKGIIERDATTGIPYAHGQRIPDKEGGALRRIKAICSHYGLEFYYQSDNINDHILYIARDKFYCNGLPGYGTLLS